MVAFDSSSLAGSLRHLTNYSCTVHERRRIVMIETVHVMSTTAAAAAAAAGCGVVIQRDGKSDVVRAVSTGTSSDEHIGDRPRGVWT